MRRPKPGALYALLADAPPLLAMTIRFLAAGGLLLGEPLRATDFAGAAVVGLGIYLVQRG